jgi:hypothetical protein
MRDLGGDLENGRAAGSDARGSGAPQRRGLRRLVSRRARRIT